MERLTVNVSEKAYEALDPVDIMDNEYTRINYQNLVNKLGEYEDLEEQGLLMRLPCKVGDAVYCIMTSLNGTHQMIFAQGFDYSMIRYFDKTVFLTRAEAEKALKRMRE